MSVSLWGQALCIPSVFPVFLARLSLFAWLALSAHALPSQRTSGCSSTCTCDAECVWPIGIGKPPVDEASVRHIMDHMKTATVRELRNEFPRIEAWVHEGESINISKRGKVIATLVPALGNVSPQPRPPKVDIMGRLRERWGGRVFTMEQVAAMRADELAGDLG